MQRRIDCDADGDAVYRRQQFQEFRGGHGPRTGQVLKTDTNSTFTSEIPETPERLDVEMANTLRVGPGGAVVHTGVHDHTLHTQVGRDIGMAKQAPDVLFPFPGVAVRRVAIR